MNPNRALGAPLSTPFNSQPPIYDGLFKKNLRDTSLKLNHVAMAMRSRFASSRLVPIELGSFQRPIEVPSTCPLCLVSEKPDYRASRCTTEIARDYSRPSEHRRFEWRIVAPTRLKTNDRSRRYDAARKSPIFDWARWWCTVVPKAKMSFATHPDARFGMKNAWYLLLLFSFPLSNGCGNQAAPVSDTVQSAIVETYPLAPPGLWDSLTTVITSIDFIFHDLPISMAVTDRSGVRNMMKHYSPELPQPVNHGCQSIGRITYVASGEVLYFGDLYYAATCSFVRFYTKQMEPAFTCKLNQRGMEFLHNIGVPMAPAY
jgi:hypothetical protein